MLADKPNMGRRARGFLYDEGGGEALEYALIAGLIVVGCIGAIRLLGQRAALGWQWISSQM